MTRGKQWSFTFESEPIWIGIIRAEGSGVGFQGDSKSCCASAISSQTSDGVNGLGEGGRISAKKNFL